MKIPGKIFVPRSFQTVSVGYHTTIAELSSSALTERSVATIVISQRRVVLFRVRRLRVPLRPTTFNCLLPVSNTSAAVLCREKYVYFCLRHIAGLEAIPSIMTAALIAPNMNWANSTCGTGA